jgi:hypothetical protein
MLPRALIAPGSDSSSRISSRELQILLGADVRTHQRTAVETGRLHQIGEELGLVFSQVNLRHRSRPFKRATAVPQATSPCQRAPSS